MRSWAVASAMRSAAHSSGGEGLLPGQLHRVRVLGGGEARVLGDAAPAQLLDGPQGQRVEPAPLPVQGHDEVEQRADPEPREAGGSGDRSGLEHVFDPPHPTAAQPESRP